MTIILAKIALVLVAIICHQTAGGIIIDMDHTTTRIEKSRLSQNYCIYSAIGSACMLLAIWLGK